MLNEVTDDLRGETICSIWGTWALCRDLTRAPSWFGRWFPGSIRTWSNEGSTLHNWWRAKLLRTTPFPTQPPNNEEKRNPGKPPRPAKTKNKVNSWKRRICTDLLSIQGVVVRRGVARELHGFVNPWESTLVVSMLLALRRLNASYYQLCSEICYLLFTG